MRRDAEPRSGTDAKDARFHTAPASWCRTSSFRKSIRRPRSSIPSSTCRRRAPILERAQNEAQTYANRVVPEARGRAAKITQDAEAYREQTVAEAKGETSRFLQIYDQYKKAPDVTRQRMYLETMERILGENSKTIIDTGPQAGPGVVPYLPLTELPQPRPQPRVTLPHRRREATNEARPYRRRHRRHPSDRRRRRLQHVVHREPDPAGVGGAAGQAGARHHRARPQRESAVHRRRHLYRQAHSQRGIAGAGNNCFRAKTTSTRHELVGERLVVDAFVRYRITDPLKFYQTVGAAGADAQLSILLNSALRRVLGAATLVRCRARQARRADEENARSARSRRQAVWNRDRRCAHPPRRSAGARTARRFISACRPNVSARRPNSAPRAAKKARRSAPEPIAT